MLLSKSHRCVLAAPGSKTGSLRLPAVTIHSVTASVCCNAPYTNKGSEQYKQFHMPKLMKCFPAPHGQQQPARTRVQASSSTEGAEDTVELDIKVGGMTCGACTGRVTEALQKLSGVRKVDVSLEKSLATVEVAANNQLDALNMLPQLIQAVADLGFEAEPFIEGLE